MRKTLQEIGDFIFISDTLEVADAIFIPGGSHPELAETAAQLYHQGFAPLIVPAGGGSVKTGFFAGSKSKKDLYPGPYIDEASFLTDVLLKNGVPASAILCENQSGTTAENGTFTRSLLDQRGISIEKAIVVCKSFHARRAKMYYENAFPQATLMVHPYPYQEGESLLTRDHWTQTEAGIKRVLGEVRRIGDQFTQEILNYCAVTDIGALAPTPVSTLGSLHHVEMYVSNLEETKFFWGWLLERLGYSVFQSWEGGISYLHGETYLVFVQVEERFQTPTYHRCRVGLNHLAFHAPSETVIDDITQELKVRGVKILYPDRHPYAGGADYYAVFFEDPDRMKVEITSS